LRHHRSAATRNVLGGVGGMLLIARASVQWQSARGPHDVERQLHEDRRILAAAERHGLVEAFKT